MKQEALARKEDRRQAKTGASRPVPPPA